MKGKGDGACCFPQPAHWLKLWACVALIKITAKTNIYTEIMGHLSEGLAPGGFASDTIYYGNLELPSTK